VYFICELKIRKQVDYFHQDKQKMYYKFFFLLLLLFVNMGEQCIIE